MFFYFDLEFFGVRIIQNFYFKVSKKFIFVPFSEQDIRFDKFLQLFLKKNKSFFRKTLTFVYFHQSCHVQTFISFTHNFPVEIICHNL